MSDTNNIHKRFEKSIKKQVKTSFQYKYNKKRLNKKINDLSSSNERLTDELSNMQKKYLKAKNKLKALKNDKKEVNNDNNKNSSPSQENNTQHNNTQNNNTQNNNTQNNNTQNNQQHTVAIKQNCELVPIVLLICFTYLFVLLSCQASNMSEFTSNFMTTNVFVLQVVLMIVYYSVSSCT